MLENRGESMAMKSVLVVFSNPVAGREDEYNEWYDNTHIPEVAAVPGVTSATRFTPKDADPSAKHGYLALYELDRPGDEVMADIATRMADGRIVMSDALDMATVDMKIWEAR